MVVHLSWLRDVKKLTVLYLAAGLAFVPWGAVYAVLRLWGGWTHRALALGFLACGTVTALLVWQHVEKRLGARATPINDPLVFHMTASYASGSEVTPVITLPLDIVFDTNAIIVQLGLVTK